MTKQEACRLLSLAIEPEPSFTDGKWVGAFPLSNGGFWIDLISYTKRSTPDLIAVNYFNNEECSQRLLEAMPEPELWVEWLGPPRRWGCVAEIINPEEACSFDADKRTAIVKCAMQHWKIEGEIEV